MSGRPLRRFIVNIFKRLVAPGMCIACGHALDHTRLLCVACAARLPRVPHPCHYCGEPWPGSGSICARCLLNPPRWQRLRAPFQYHGLVREYLIRFKFDEALYLANSLCQQGMDSFHDGDAMPEVLLPVPLHYKRLLERGYNQADEIAKLISSELDIPIDRRALQRVRHTPGQSGLSANQRALNVRQAFAYAPRIEYRHVALVDDVVTTGSTAAEITKLLHRGGVEFVEVWALARRYRK